MLFTSGQLWLIVAMYWFYVFGFIFFMFWLPKYLTEARGLSKQAMGDFRRVDIFARLSETWREGGPAIASAAVRPGDRPQGDRRGCLSLSGI